MKTLNRNIVIAGGLALSSIVVASLAVAGNLGHHHKRHHMVHATSIDSSVLNQGSTPMETDWFRLTNMARGWSICSHAWTPTEMESWKVTNCPAG